MNRAMLSAMCGAVVCLGSAALGPQPPSGDWVAPVRLKAVAVDLMNGATAGKSSGSDFVQIVVERWSTNEEHQSVVAALRVGETALVRALESVKTPVGYLRYPRSDEAMPPEDRSFPLLYAAQTVDRDGTRRLVTATTKQSPYVPEIPVTIIEMRFGTNDVGEGRIAAGEVVGSGAQAVLQLSNYTNARRCLRMIRRE